MSPTTSVGFLSILGCLFDRPLWICRMKMDAYLFSTWVKTNRGLVSLQWFSLCSIVLLIIVVSLLAVPHFLELFSIIFGICIHSIRTDKIKETPKTLILVFLFYFRKVSFSFLTICCATKKSFLNWKKHKKYKYDLKYGCFN